ncbi:type III secretion protein [Trinickia sp. YCB016]
MKLLRILTGMHAGAQLQLAPGTHRIGADDDADIRLTDWRGTHALLHIDASGVVSAQRAAAPAAPETVPAAAEGQADAQDTQSAQHEGDEVVLLVDFVPMQFDETILCVGPDDAVWPSDLDLLSTLLTRPAEARVAEERKKRKRYVGAVAVCFAVGALIVAGSLLTTMQMSRAALPRNADDRAQRVTEALAAAHVGGLHAQALGGTVVVTGMLASRAEDQAVRTLLDRISPTGITRNYDIAQDDARSIEDSLGVAGAHVSYLGGGAFAVTGTVSSRTDLDNALARVRADLDANVKTIAVQAKEASSSSDTPPGGGAGSTYSEMISSDDVRYAQTPDGVKHIYAVDPPAAASDAAASGAAQANGASGASGAASANASPSAAPANAASADRATVSRSAGIDGGVPLPDPATLPPGARAGG